MKTIVISDAHIGSKHFLCEEFIRFVKNIPSGATLVLNGDTIDHWHARFSEKEQNALDFLKKESLVRRVIWVRGNHDRRSVLDDPGKIEFTHSYSIEKRLFVSHGHDFDKVMPRHRMFIVFFRSAHHFFIKLGAESVHVAFFAKRFPFLYGVLRKHVRKNAVRYARSEGFQAVTCGHTHYAEDTMSDGIRYINTGSWTEKPIYYLEIDDKDMKLMKVE